MIYGSAGLVLRGGGQGSCIWVGFCCTSRTCQVPVPLWCGVSVLLAHGGLIGLCYIASCGVVVFVVS